MIARFPRATWSCATNNAGATHCSAPRSSGSIADTCATATPTSTRSGSMRSRSRCGTNRACSVTRAPDATAMPHSSGGSPPTPPESPPGIPTRCVMSVSPTKISTTVRLYARYQWLRLGFRLGGLLRPQATLRRAGDLFCTPLPNSRTRALAASTGAALEADLDLDGLHLHTYVWGDPLGRAHVLFAHGWSSHGPRFLPWGEHLRGNGHAVGAFDQTANGRHDGRPRPDTKSDG